MITLCTGLTCFNVLGNPVAYGDCVSTCVARNIPGLSSGCAVCYGDRAACGVAAFCFNVCQFNSCGLQCQRCLELASCTDAFATCRGLEGDGCQTGTLPTFPGATQ